MFDYLHGDVCKQARAASAADVSSKLSAVALRTQVAL